MTVAYVFPSLRIYFAILDVCGLLVLYNKLSGSFHLPTPKEIKVASYFRTNSQNPENKTYIEQLDEI